MKLEERVNQEIRLWGLEILRLHKKGISPSEAVRQAYKRHPVFSLVRENIKAEMPKAAKRGYGKGELPEDTGDQLAKIPWSADGLNLSQRTTRGSKQVVAAVEKSLEDSISRGQSVKETAMAIFDGYSQGGIIPEQDIPEFMKKLLEVAPARDYGGTEYKALLREARRNVEKLSSRALKAAYNQIIDAIEDGNERLIEKAVHTATQEKTRYFAERIARTEMSRAYFDGFLAKYLDDPDVVAFKLHLSKSHPNTDICDLYAEADLFGMGKGIFPKDQLPDYPFHPHCMCRWEPLYSGSRKLKSETPKPQFDAGINAYLKKLSNGSRAQILGVNGSQDYAKTGNWRDHLIGWKEPRLQESRLNSVSVPSFIEADFDTVAREYTIDEIQEMADNVDKTISKYFVGKSMWSGKVVLAEEGDPPGKLWNCDVRMTSKTSESIIMHELIHARSVSLADLDTYRKFSFLEEGSVELMAREICKAEGIQYVRSEAYAGYIKALEEISDYFGYKDYMEFSKELLSVNLKDRYNWLEEKYFDAHRNVSVCGNSELQKVREALDSLWNDLKMSES